MQFSDLDLLHSHAIRQSQTQHIIFQQKHTEEDCVEVECVCVHAAQHITLLWIRL